MGVGVGVGLYLYFRKTFVLSNIFTAQKQIGIENGS